MSIARFLTTPPPYYRGPVWFNRAGMQVVRMTLSEAAYAMRARSVPEFVARDVETLERDGLLVIEDFLSADEVERARAYCQEMSAAGEFSVQPNRRGSGVDWIIGDVTVEKDEGRWAVERVTRDRRLVAIVEAVTRRKSSRRPRLRYNRLEVPPGGAHENDLEGVLHADRHFSHIKAYVCLNDNREENGAFVFAPASHKFTLARLRHEYDYSVRYAQCERHGVDPVYGRCTVSPLAIREMDVKERSIETRAGALVLSDNRGFHKRGTIQPGRVREQLRLVYQYLEEPFYATAAFDALDWVSRRGLLPEKAQSRLRRRGIIL